MHDLVLLRHGHAPGASEAGVAADSERPLSKRGLKGAAAAARRLKAAGFEPELIVSSPYLRAARTADIAQEQFPSARRVVAPALADGNAAGVLELLSGSGLGPGAGVLVVGHQPLLGMLAGYFLGRGAFHLEPAGFVRIKTRDGSFAPDPDAVLAEEYSPEGDPS